MNSKHRRSLEQAAETHKTVTVTYAKPGGVITRHVRPYELSVNRSGRAVVWGTDSIHGARAIHSFRADRILSVSVSDRARTFRPAKSVSKYLR